MCLIEKDELMDLVEQLTWQSPGDGKRMHSGAIDEEHAYVKYKEVEDAIIKAKTVDAEPVKHGKWIDDSDIKAYIFSKRDEKEKRPLERCHCSICGFTKIVNMVILGADAFTYCPSCGAKMDGGEPNAE